MTTKEFLEKEAGRFGFNVTKVFDGDYDLRVAVAKASASDLIQLVAILEENAFSLTFLRDNSIHVHAPHRKEHSWGDRGWDCTYGLTILGCETFRKEEPK